MKKKLSVALSVMLVLMFALFAVASSSDTDDSDKSAVTQSSGEVITEAAEDSNSLGSYEVEIKNARISENYEGKATVIITYGFTNNSSESASFYIAIDETVYQNGVGLERTYTLKDGDPYDEANQSKEIKSGVTLDVDVAYVLNDLETDIEVEAKETFSFTDDIVSKTFSIK